MILFYFLFPIEPMANLTTSTTAREFCVWADCNCSVYQHVSATTLKEAYHIANENPHLWERCFEDERDDYRVWNDVKDVATSKHFLVAAPACGSEIVETINDSNFRDGECGACEYERYRSQPGLLEACKGVCGMIYRDKSNDERIDFDQYEQAELACRAAITKAEHGNAK